MSAILLFRHAMMRAAAAISKYIKFADQEVLRVLLENITTDDGIGLTTEDVEGVTSIGTWFNGNTEITSFDEFEKFVNAQVLGQNAFNGCTSLSSIAMENVTSLGSSAFYGCTSLEIDDLALPNLTSLGQNAFYGVKIKKISDLGKITALPTASSSTQNFGDKSVLEEVVLPSTVTSIKQYSFYGYSSLQSINLNNITTIGTYAFSKCAGLSGILDLSHVVNIYGYCFNGCSGLEDIYLGEDVEVLETLNRYAKYKYSQDGILRFPKLKSLYGPVFQSSLIKRVESLGEITDLGGAGYSYVFTNSTVEFVDVPSTCTSIASRAFWVARSLTTLICRATTPPQIAGDTFYAADSLEVIYVPDASVEAYQAATNWATYASQIKGFTEVDTLPSSATEGDCYKVGDDFYVYQNNEFVKL